MADLSNRQQIQILNQLSPSYSTMSAIVASGGVSTIAAGTPTKSADAVTASNTGAVVPMVDGDGTTAHFFTGIAKSTSTDTASTAGSVTNWLPYPGLIYSAAAKSTAAFDTQGEIDILFQAGVFFDLTAGVWTVDTAASNNKKVNCVVIVGGEYQTSTVYFYYAGRGTMLNYCISA